MTQPDQENLVSQALMLQKRCYSCRECPLGNRKVDGEDPHVFACGRLDADVMFLGEAPGADEVRARVPLIGRSGRFFENSILAAAGLERRNVYVTNAVLCRPNEQNRTPNLGEVEICRPHLDAQVLMVRPKLIVTLGNIALWAVSRVQKIQKNRGRLRWSKPWSDGSIVPVFPMYHPSYCLRGSGLSETAQDAEKLKTYARGLSVGNLMVAEDIHVLCELTAAAEC